jgi:hypothetical protein
MQPRAEYLAVNAGEDWVSMFESGEVAGGSARPLALQSLHSSIHGWLL